MADGKGPILNLQGKVNRDHALELVDAGGTGTVPTTATGSIGSLVGSVDGSNKLKVRVV